MDGFHLHDDELARLGLSDRKGAPDTFAVPGYLALLRRIRSETRHTVYAPEFDRHHEQSVAGAIAVRAEHRLVLTEGNYLLYDGPGWSDVLPLLDEAWYVEGDEQVRLSRLVQRHLDHGKPPEVAQRWARMSDQANADLVAHPGSRGRARGDRLKNTVANAIGRTGRTGRTGPGGHGDQAERRHAQRAPRLRNGGRADLRSSGVSTGIVHFGVGGFHRARTRR
jgi:pantothenate kinase